MRSFAPFVAAAAAFGLTPLAARIGTVPGSLLLVALGVLFAVAASGGATALTVTAGALGAFVAAVISPASAATAGALVVGLAYAERTTRVRGRTAQLVHAGVALGVGALAGVLAASYADASLTFRVVSLVVAAVLASLPLLVDADDLLAHALDAIAVQVDEPSRGALVAGAELRRHAGDVCLDRTTARGVERTWRALLRLAEGRLRLQRSRAPGQLRESSATSAANTAGAGSPTAAVIAMVDRRITEHVAALSRALAATDAVRAAELGLDDAALRSVENAGESLEEVSRAIVDTAVGD